MVRPSFVDERKGPNEHRFENIKKSSFLSQYHKSPSANLDVISREDKILEPKSQSPSNNCYDAKYEKFMLKSLSKQ